MKKALLLLIVILFTFVNSFGQVGFKNKVKISNFPNSSTFKNGVAYKYILAKDITLYRYFNDKIEIEKYKTFDLGSYLTNEGTLAPQEALEKLALPSVYPPCSLVAITIPAGTEVYWGETQGGYWFEKEVENGKFEFEFVPDFNDDLTRDKINKIRNKGFTFIGKKSGGSTQYFLPNYQFPDNKIGKIIKRELNEYWQNGVRLNCNYLIN